MIPHSERARPSNTMHSFVTDELVDIVVDMLARRWKKSAISAAIRDVVGHKASVGTVERILSMARERIRVESQQTRETEVAETVAFLKHVIADESTTTKEKLEAQSQLRELLGLDAKFSQEHRYSGYSLAEELKRAQQKMEQLTGDSAENETESS